MYRVGFDDVNHNRSIALFYTGLLIYLYKENIGFFNDCCQQIVLIALQEYFLRLRVTVEIRRVGMYAHEQSLIFNAPFSRGYEDFLVVNMTATE